MMETLPRGQPLLGVLLKVLSTIAFAAMATQIKLLSDRYPAGEVAFFRSAFALIPVLGFVAIPASASRHCSSRSRPHSPEGSSAASISRAKRRWHRCACAPSGWR